MPTKKKLLILKYKEWNGRPAPSFDVSHLLDDSLGDDNDIDNNNDNNDADIDNFTEVLK
jgi:hypothetical protein